MINSRNISDLDPEVQQLCLEHIRLCRDQGIEIIITSTYRDFEAQDDLYAIGRTKQPERLAVTNSKAGKSWHNFKCAYDVVPVVAGKPVWNSTDPVWKEVIRIGKSLGLEAGADWKSFPDRPHFQYLPRVEDKPISLEDALVRWNTNKTIFET